MVMVRFPQRPTEMEEANSGKFSHVPLVPLVSSLFITSIIKSSTALAHAWSLLPAICVSGLSVKELAVHSYTATVLFKCDSLLPRLYYNAYLPAEVWLKTDSRGILLGFHTILIPFG